MQGTINDSPIQIFLPELRLPPAAPEVLWALMLLLWFVLYVNLHAQL